MTMIRLKKDQSLNLNWPNVDEVQYLRCVGLEWYESFVPYRVGSGLSTEEVLPFLGARSYPLVGGLAMVPLFSRR